MNDAMPKAALWIRENPGAWAWMVYFALEATEAGRRFGMKALAERVRWEMSLSVGGARSYKLDNRITAPLARILVATYPEVRPYIELRQSGTDKPSHRAYDEISLDTHGGALFDLEEVSAASTARA